MKVFYFTLHRNEYKPVQANETHYVKVVCESKELATDAFNSMHPRGYSGIYTPDNFSPDINQILIETITQKIR